MRELDRLAAFKSQIYLYGQVKDTVLFPLAPSVLSPAESSHADAAWKLGSLREALFEYFRARGYAIIGAYNLVDGLVFADAPAAGLPQPLLGGPVKSEAKAKEGAEDEELTMAQLYEQLVELGEKVAKADARGGRHPRARLIPNRRPTSRCTKCGFVCSTRACRACLSSKTPGNSSRRRPICAQLTVCRFCECCRLRAKVARFRRARRAASGRRAKCKI